MSSVAPTVRHLLLRDDVQYAATNLNKINLLGLLTNIRLPGEEDTFPFQHSFAIFLLLTGGRGIGQGQIVVVNADTEEPVYVGSPHTIDCGSDPLRVMGVTFRILVCEFPAAGLY
jgi:hypothetical protein